MAENLKPLLYWVKEREAIRKRKIARAEGEEVANDNPLTKDPILATYRFCNVRRRDDRVSRWLIEHVLTDANLKKAGLSSFLMFSAWCRWVNWPPTIKAVMDAKLWPKKQVDWAAIGRLVDKLGKTNKVWTGAYMIRAPKKKGAKKGNFIATQVIGKHFKKLVPALEADFRYMPRGTSYRVVHEMLCGAENFGSFMAGQIAGDWTYTSLLGSADDLRTWAPMGPGSVRGFNRIMGNPGKLSKRPPEQLWLSKLQKWREAIIRKLGPEYGDLTALDVQNVLCEVDKYLRVKNGEGRPRAKYSPHTY